MNNDDDIDKKIEDKEDVLHADIFDDDEIDDGIEHILNKYASLRIKADDDVRVDDLKSNTNGIINSIVGSVETGIENDVVDEDIHKVDGVVEEETVDDVLNRIMERTNTPYSYYGKDYLHSSKRKKKDLTVEVSEEAFEGDVLQTQAEYVEKIPKESSVESEKEVPAEDEYDSEMEAPIEEEYDSEMENPIEKEEEIKKEIKEVITFEEDDNVETVTVFDVENASEKEVTIEEENKKEDKKEDKKEAEIENEKEDEIENKTIAATDEVTQTESKDESEEELRIEVTAEVQRKSLAIVIGDATKDMSTSLLNEEGKDENKKTELEEKNSSNENNNSNKNSTNNSTSSDKKTNSDKKKNSKKKKSKVTDIIYDIVRYAVMGVALFLFGYAAYELTLIYVESREAEELKSSTSDMFFVSLEDLQESYEPPTNSEGETISLENENDGKLFVFDYKKMLSYNSHSKGYIRQENGEYIDNPILQHPTDNEYYLSHLVDHRKSSVGAIYIDTAIEEGLNAKNCVIYGHNIAERAGKIMFGSLNWYWNKTGYYKEHPTFDIWIEDTRYRYYVFAVYKTEAAGSPVYQYAFSSDEEFMDYAKMCKENSKYNFKTAPEITKDSYIITLSTCTHSDEYRMIVQLVRGEELDIYGNPVEGSN